MYLRIEIIDDDSEEGYHWLYFVDLETRKADIMTAIRVFFPTAYDIHMYVVESKDED